MAPRRVAHDEGLGPFANFADMPDLVKMVLSVFMILGRLEFYAAVALLMPSLWKR